MIIDTKSSYPDKIDPLVFFEDIGIDEEIFDKNFELLLSQEKYDEAQEYIADKKIYQMNADMFNLIVNRIEATQKYIESNRINITHYGDNEPTNLQKNMIWIV